MSCFKLFYTLLSLILLLINGDERRRLFSVSCNNRVSSPSGPNEGDVASIGCLSGYTLTSCGITSLYANNEGSYISSNICNARNGNPTGGTVQAIARCCNLGNSINTCRDVTSAISGSSDDAHVSAQCNSNEFTFGCSITTPNSNIDGACPGSLQCASNPGRSNPGALYTVGMGGYCTAVNGASITGVYARARCCSSNTNGGYTFECVERWGSQSAATDDTTSQVTCFSGYFLSGCSAWTAWSNIDGWYISGDTCFAKNGAGGLGVWAIAICCKVVCYCKYIYFKCFYILYTFNYSYIYEP